jgi:hypothetical protein
MKRGGKIWPGQPRPQLPKLNAKVAQAEALPTHAQPNASKALQKMEAALATPNLPQLRAQKKKVSLRKSNASLRLMNS